MIDFANDPGQIATALHVYDKNTHITDIQNPNAGYDMKAHLTNYFQRLKDSMEAIQRWSSASNSLTPAESLTIFTW